MRRFLFASVVAFVLGSFGAPDRSGAVIVECANCASIVEQLISDAKQAQQYLTQVATLQSNLNQYAQLVRAGLTLPQSVYAAVQADISQVRQIANAASVLTGNSGSILTRLSLAQGYANQAMSLPQNMGAQVTIWQQTLANAGTTLGRTLGVQAGQETNYTALQAAIQAHGATAAGQTQAIQAGVEMSGLVSTQLNQIQTTLTAAAQQQATVNAVQAERQAIGDAYAVQFFSKPDAPLTGYKRY